MRASDLRRSPGVIVFGRIVRRLGIIVAVLCVIGVGVYFLDTGPDIPGYLKSAPQGKYTELAWDDMKKGNWDTPSHPTYPASVLKADGKRVTISGYITPFHEPGEASVMFVTSRPRGCYFCNPPGVSEVVMVQIRGGKKLEQTTSPVTVYGVFHVADGSGDAQTLYTMDDAQLQVCL